jgi:hypothetical protein
LEKRGIPTATIVTKGFVKAAEAHRRLLKRPDLPYFATPHPMSSMSHDALTRAADEIYDGILKVVESSIAAAKPADPKP